MSTLSPSIYLHTYLCIYLSIYLSIYCFVYLILELTTNTQPRPMIALVQTWRIRRSVRADKFTSAFKIMHICVCMHTVDLQSRLIKISETLGSLRNELSLRRKHELRVISLASRLGMLLEHMVTQACLYLFAKVLFSFILDPFYVCFCCCCCFFSRLVVCFVF